MSERRGRVVVMEGGSEVGVRRSSSEGWGVRLGGVRGGRMERWETGGFEEGGVGDVRCSRRLGRVRVGFGGRRGSGGGGARMLSVLMIVDGCCDDGRKRRFLPCCSDSSSRRTSGSFWDSFVSYTSSDAIVVTSSSLVNRRSSGRGAMRSRSRSDGSALESQTKDGVMLLVRMVLVVTDVVVEESFEVVERTWVVFLVTSRVG